MRLVTLPLTEDVAVLLQRRPDELGLLPQVRRQEAICAGDSHKRRLERVLLRLGRTSGRCVAVGVTGQL